MEQGQALYDTVNKSASTKRPGPAWRARGALPCGDERQACWRAAYTHAVGHRCPLVAQAGRAAGATRGGTHPGRSLRFRLAVRSACGCRRSPDRPWPPPRRLRTSTAASSAAPPNNAAVTAPCAAACSGLCDVRVIYTHWGHSGGQHCCINAFTSSRRNMLAELRSGTSSLAAAMLRRDTTQYWHWTGNRHLIQPATLGCVGRCVGLRRLPWQL